MSPPDAGPAGERLVWHPPDASVPAAGSAGGVAAAPPGAGFPVGPPVPAVDPDPFNGDPVAVDPLDVDPLDADPLAPVPFDADPAVATGTANRAVPDVG